MKQSMTAGWYPYILAIGTVLILVVAGIGIATLIRRAPSEVIAQDIRTLQKIFETINRDAVIVDFEDERTPINFLTVEKFVGSSVGGMNLRNPDKWQGPYVADNPTIQEKHYVILTTQNGTYIVPDTGVRLSSGKVIGQDIILNAQSDIGLLIAQKVLDHNGAPLAAQISVGNTQSTPIMVTEEA